MFDFRYMLLATIRSEVILLISVFAQLSVVSTDIRPETKQVGKVSVKVSTSIVESASQVNAKDNWQPASPIILRPDLDILRHQRSTNLDSNYSPQISKFNSQDAVTSEQPSDTIDWNAVIRAHLPNKSRIQDQTLPILNGPSNYKRSTSSSLQIAIPEVRSTTAPNYQPINEYHLTSRNWQVDEPTRDGSNSKRASDEVDTNNQLTQQRTPIVKCHRQNLAKILSDAKNLLTGGFTILERSATTGNLILGSGLLAAAIPLFAYFIPEYTNSRNLGGNDRLLANIGLQGRAESVIGWIEQSVEHLPNFPRLQPQECIKRSICEAHLEPDKHGALGFTLRLLFPGNTLSSTDQLDDMDNKVANKYRYAAAYGLSNRLQALNGTGSMTACKEKYDDCLVSLLEVARNLVDVLLK